MQSKLNHKQRQDLIEQVNNPESILQVLNVMSDSGLGDEQDSGRLYCLRLG